MEDDKTLSENHKNPNSSQKKQFSLKAYSDRIRIVANKKKRGIQSANT